MSDATDFRSVRYRRYDESLDMTGKNLIGLLDRPQEDVIRLIPSMAVSSTLRVTQVPVERLKSMTGEIANELHEWPNAKMGDRFCHLTIHFLDGRMLGFNWKFSTPAAAPKRPWYRRLLGIRS